MLIDIGILPSGFAENCLVIGSSKKKYKQRKSTKINFKNSNWEKIILIWLLCKCHLERRVSTQRRRTFLYLQPCVGRDEADESLDDQAEEESEPGDVEVPLCPEEPHMLGRIRESQFGCCYNEGPLTICIWVSRWLIPFCCCSCSSLLYFCISLMASRKKRMSIATFRCSYCHHHFHQFLLSFLPIHRSNK